MVFLDRKSKCSVVALDNGRLEGQPGIVEPTFQPQTPQGAAAVCSHLAVLPSKADALSRAAADEEKSGLQGPVTRGRQAGRHTAAATTRESSSPGQGEVELNVPKLRGATFQTAVIELYRRREILVEEAIVEMYLAGVSTRRSRTSRTSGSARVLRHRLQPQREGVRVHRGLGRQRPLEGDYPYVFVDGI